ncbi:LysR substrate-binding domain-containing protein [Mucilaginibacter antarcticus]|uniref:LysR substrate-binding domain-containing protein n=1 Tax=Mucilaginibacter antarcticus TaxID=1855725 RepID=A0ABW5XR08_9SPHI
MPGFDFRLRVFYEVSTRLSFTKAASRLNITQPAVSKHIQEMEHQLNVRLFSRNGNNIKLTPAGEIVHSYAAKIITAYSNLESELSQLSDISEGIIHIGASTTVAQTVLPKILALLKKNHPKINFTFVQGNTDFITQQVINETIDVAIVEGIKHNPQISYTPFLKDEIVLVTSSKTKLAKRGEIKASELYDIPLVMREAGAGTLEVILEALRAAGIAPAQLDIEIELESTIAIKQYLLYSEAASFLSVQSITNELKYQQLAIVDIEGLQILRDFQCIQLHGNTSKLISFFKRFCLSNHN